MSEARTITLSSIFGADPTGVADSYTALQNAVTQAQATQCQLVIDGHYRINTGGRLPITVSAASLSAPSLSPVRIVGRDSRAGNVPSGDLHGSCLYFDQDSPDCILLDNTHLEIDGVAIIGNPALNTGNAIRVIGLNSALRLCGGTVVQSFHTGVRVENGFYHDFENLVLADNVLGMAIAAPPSESNVYNLTARKLKIVGKGPENNSVAMIIFDGSQVSLTQSSIESFNQDGIRLQGAGSTLNISQSYFEGNGGWNILCGPDTIVNATENLVYLNAGTSRWISVEGGEATGVHICSRNNRFVPPQDESTVDAYMLLNDDPDAYYDIRGDTWPSYAGANTHYIGSSLYTGTGPRMLQGQIEILYPVGHSRQNFPTSTIPWSPDPTIGGLTGTPKPAMMLPYGNNGYTGDDPIGLHFGAWGYNPYMAIFHKGQWEKVGLRLSDIAPATDPADAVTKLNQLLTELRSAGVMV